MQNRNELLSSAARARMDAMLPGLLLTVRARRRRRHAAFAAGGLSIAALVVGVCWHGAARDDDVLPPQQAPWQAAPVCRVVRDDPDVVARYRVDAVDRAEWFVDDDELQAFLRDSARPAGIVRVEGRAIVATTALDPFPAATE